MADTPHHNPFTFAGRVAVVTGGAQGIGAGIADVLAEAGATVVIADRDRANTQARVDAMTGVGHRAVGISVDLADEASVAAATATIAKDLGAPWLLVNNAALQDREFLLETSASHWDQIHTVNARGTFLMTREVAKTMVAAGQGGRIVNIATNALRGGLIMGLAAYTSSKGAVLALSRVSAFELAEHQITVNTILPGAVLTPGAVNAKGPMTDGPATRPTPFGLQDPRDIGAAVLFFGSDAASRITNQVLAVDGGFSVS